LVPLKISLDKLFLFWYLCTYTIFRSRDKFKKKEEFEMIILRDLNESILQGNDGRVIEIVEEAVKNKVPVKEILNEGLIGAMNIVGTKFKNCELYVPEVLKAARAMKSGIEVIRPLLEKAGVETLGKVVIGTVKGDLHDIGKNLVAMMVEGSGFEIVNLGVDVSPEKFVDAAKAKGVKICMMSALLTTTMPAMKDTIEALKEAGLGGKVKTMIGGAPVTKKFADEIGANGFGSNAAEAVDVAKRLIRD
jgi:5-methyltetrahydrofolate--homocysteine methyltransferase